MRKQLFRVLLAVSVGLVFASAAAEAQSMKKMTVHVPFTFHVLGKPYPAGAYVIVREGAFLYLRNSSRVLNVWTVNSLVTKTVPKESKLVFFEYQGVHLLTQVIWQGDSTGSEFVRSGHEEEVARQIVPADVTTAQVGGK
jgi:hypothetical protein